MGVSVFVFSDIEGSTQLWSTAPDAMREALRVHDEIARAAVRGGDGDLVKHTGDGFLARFDAVRDAIRVALAVQRDLQASTLTSLDLRLRMAVHAGEAERRDDDWFGTTINRAARMLELGHGGQILVSGVVAALIEDMPIGDCTLLDLGVHPLRDLTVPEHVFQVLAPGLDARMPALRGVAEVAVRRLPRRRSSFVGRRGELERAPAAIDDHRLISLVGAGGIGKTRLAEEITIGRSDGGDRVWWVDLTRADHAHDVAAVLVDATNARGSPGADPVDVVAGALRRAGGGLLVVDNCEHVLATIGDVVDRLLDAVGSLTVLATSRRPLGLDGEHVWRLAPLSVPPRGAGTEDGAPLEAVTLFLQRARQVQPDLVIDAANRPLIDEICRRLDGLPLALELAAARLRHVGFGDLLASLEGTFPLLRDEHQPIRHRTLSDSLRASHDVLSQEAQELLWLVAVFIGPFTAKAAANLGVVECPTLLDQLGELVDASLVEFDVGTGSYRLLETVRQFALSAATAHGHDADLRDRHLARCLALAAMWAADQTVISLDVVDDIVGERSNLVTALEWSCRPGRQPAVELVAPLAAAAIAQRLVVDTSAWSTQLLAALAGQDRAAWARAVAACARLRTELGDVEFLERAVPAAAEIARASGDVATEAACMMMLGAAAFVAGNATWSTQLADAAELAVAAGRAPLELEIRSWLAWSLACNGQAADADVHLARCARLGASESIHAQQCATAEHIASTWSGRPVDEQFGAILPGATDHFMSFASALRCLYTGDATGLEVGDNDDRSPMATIMRSIQTALRVLLIDDDPMGAASEIEPLAEEPWLGRPVFPVVWLAATLALAAGHTATARSFADIAASVAAPAGWGVVGVAMLRSELALDDGDLAVAEQAALDGLAVAVRQDLRPWVCDLVQQIAFIDVAAGRMERAIVLARATAEAREATGYHYRLAHRRARWYKDIGPLRGSQAWADAAADLESAAEWLLRSRGVRARARTGWGALTPTELVVIGHVSDGLTNAEVAARMFVSPATVKSHLEHIYAKLGVRGRVAALTEAARHQGC